MGALGRFKDRSQLKSRIIKKVLLNKKDYKFQEFSFKIDEQQGKYMGMGECFYVDVFDFDKKILRIRVVERKDIQEEKRFDFDVVYFNPQTDNDCYSINHIIATFGNLVRKDLEHQDRGNADIIKNQFVFRVKPNYYSYVKVWVRGEIKDENYDKDLSFEFATNEYISYIKKMYKCKRIERGAIKKTIGEIVGKILQKKIVENLGKK